MVLAKYREIKANLKLEKQNCLPVPTWFCSRYNCVRDLLDKRGYIVIEHIDHVIEVRNQQMQKRDDFLDVVRDPNFWENLKKLGDLFVPHRSLLGNLRIIQATYRAFMWNQTVT